MTLLCTWWIWRDLMATYYVCYVRVMHSSYLHFLATCLSKRWEGNRGQKPTQVTCTLEKHRCCLVTAHLILCTPASSPSVICRRIQREIRSVVVVMCRVLWHHIWYKLSFHAEIGWCDKLAKWYYFLYYVYNHFCVSWFDNSGWERQNCDCTATLSLCFVWSIFIGASETVAANWNSEIVTKP